MKKTLFVICVVLTVSMLVTACSVSSSSGSSGSVNITVAAWNDAADALKAEIPGFNKKYPNIMVNVQYEDSSYTKIMPELVSGTNVPDIIQTQQRDFPAFLKKFPGEFVDLTDKTKDLKSKFVSSAWESTEKGGKVYAMPWDIGPVGLYYRKDLFEKAGINPRSIKTWDDFIAAGKTLQKKIPGVFMWGYGEDDDTPFSMLFNEAGGNYVTPDGKIALNSKEAIQALNTLKKMKDAGILLDFKDWNGQITALNNNKLATVVYPVWYAGTMMNSVKNQSGKWGIIPMPAYTAGGNNHAISGGSVLAITKQSENKDAAWKFIQYCLATDEGQKVMLKYGLFPSYTPFYNSDEFKKKVDYFGMPIYSFFASQAENTPPINHGPIMLDANKPLRDMEQAVLSGQSGDEATKTVAQTIAKLTGLKVK